MEGLIIRRVGVSRDLMLLDYTRFLDVGMGGIWLLHVLARGTSRLLNLQAFEIHRSCARLYQVVQRLTLPTARSDLFTFLFYVANAATSCSMCLIDRGHLLFGHFTSSLRKQRPSPLFSMARQWLATKGFFLQGKHSNLDIGGVGFSVLKLGYGWSRVMV